MYQEEILDNTAVRTQVSPKVKLSLQENGAFEYEVSGDINQDTLDALSEFMNNANFYKQKTSDEKQKSNEESKKYDSIVICFVGCVFCTMVFFTQTVVSTIGNSLRGIQSQTVQTR